MTVAKNSKKILILGASILQVPAILKAKALDMQVAVVDLNPQAVGIQYADEYFAVSTVDTEAVAQVVEKFKPDGLMTMASDMPIRTIAALAERFNLPGPTYETAIKATDKGLMIEAFAAQGVPCPRFWLIANEAQLLAKQAELLYPCIVKPTDSAGSRGVIRVDSPAELIQAYQYSVQASPAKRVIVEEYLQGAEVSVEVLCIDSAIHILAITDKRTSGAPNFVELGHSQPSTLPAALQTEIKAVAAQAVRALGITDGPAHVELMCTASGVKMIELGHRMGGDFISSHLVPLSTGIDMVEACILLACGCKPTLPAAKKGAAAVQFLSAGCGKITQIKGLNEAQAVKGVVAVEVFKQVGELSQTLANSLDRAACVIAAADTPQQALLACSAAAAKLEFVLEAGTIDE